VKRLHSYLIHISGKKRQREGREGRVLLTFQDFYKDQRRHERHAGPLSQLWRLKLVQSMRPLCPPPTRVASRTTGGLGFVWGTSI
jgi:hypothetical protein